LISSNMGMFKYCWVWNKEQGGNFLNAKKQPLRQSEDIILFYQNQCIYNPQLTQKEIGKIRKIGKRKPFDGGYIGKMNGKLSDDYDDSKSYLINILSFSSRMQECNSINRVHPTQKPVALMEYLIKTYTNEGETVLDFCAGSFTTAIACINTNRDFIGIEKDEQFFKVGEERIAKHVCS